MINNLTINTKSYNTLLSIIITIIIILIFPNLNIYYLRYLNHHTLIITVLMPTLPIQTDFNPTFFDKNIPIEPALKTSKTKQIEF